MIRIVLAVLVVAMLSATPRWATAQVAIPSPAAQQDWNRQMRQVQREAVLALLDSRVARDLLLAALLYPLVIPEAPAEAGAALTPVGDPDSEPARLLDRAAEIDPDDPLIAWAQASCPASRAQAGCDRTAGRQRLLRLDPDNGFVRLLWLEDLKPEQDLIAGALLSEAGRSQRFDSYHNAIGRLFLDFFSGLSWPPAPQPAMTAEAVAIGYLAALATPPYGQLSRLCLPGGEPPQDRDLGADCVAVFERMAAWEEGSMTDATIAAAHLVRLGEGGPHEARWREQQRRLRWLQEQALPIMARPDFVTGAGQDHVRRWFEDGEVQAMRTLLRQHGVTIEPPLDWRPAPQNGSY